MSLRVWLPLNGDLQNKGLDDVNIVNNGATVSDSGKIGRCYQFGQNKNIKLVDYASIFLTYEDFSLSVWFKCTARNTAHNGTALISGGNWNAASNLLNLGLVYFNSDHYTQLLVSGADNWSHGYPYNFYLNQWYHVVLTSGNGAVRAYVNGQLIGDSYDEFMPSTLAQSWICIGNGTYMSVFPFYGYMNDVRIYDHALSVKQVKQLSKGLILHYKLDNNGMGCPNILTGTYYNSYDPSLASIPGVATNSAGIWKGSSGGNGTFSVTKDETCPVGNYSWNITNNTSGNRDFQQGNQPYINGQQYTTSFWAKGNGTCLYRSWNTTDVKQMFEKTWALTNDWKYYTHTFTASKEMQTDNCTFHLGVTGNANISICGMKMELGSVATPYSVAKGELGANTQIYDSSGYQNNGTIIGNIQAVNDSSRYNIATDFDGNESGILIENLFLSNIINTAITYSFWIKPKGENAGRSVYFGSYPSTSWSIEKGIGNKLRLWWNGNPIDMVSTALIIDNIWQHIVITKNGTNDIKVYINGDLKQTLTGNHSNLNFPTTYRIGRDYRVNDGIPYHGLMSDFRIYCTALSENDIKELYQTSVSIDRNNNIFVREVVE